MRRRRRDISIGDERGFSVILALFVLVAVSVLLAGAVDAVLDNAQPTRTGLDQKRALLAADAGLSVYDQALNSNPNYWSSCPISGAAGATGTTGTTVTVPGSTDDGSKETYTYENLPATGQTGCNAANPISSMIEKTNTDANGTFRVQVTGSSQPTSGSAHPITRTIVAQFNAATLLQYVYFTNFEILDPTTQPSENISQCDIYYPARTNSNCGGAINFVTGDSIKGPLHSNDAISILGSPSFGSTSSDAIETPGFYTANGSVQSSCVPLGCTVNGAISNTNNQPLNLPSNDSQDEQVADDNVSTQTNGCYTGGGCVFSGPTTIVLNGANNTFNVTNTLYQATGKPTTNIPWPADGVIYVANTTGGCALYTPFFLSSSTYTNAGGCGNATVSGTYSQSLTISTQNDIIINGNISPYGTTLGAVPSGTALLGLIANDFVRIYHPLSGTRPSAADNSCPSPNTNGSGSLSNLYVYAGILAITHSFIVDNYDCGGETPSLGQIFVYGAIAQNYRGPVGTEGSFGVNSGYLKNYNYDTRFQALSPPYFINPVNAGWEVNRVTECDNTC
jgi:Tfp pilus assembly protein PilX